MHHVGEKDDTVTERRGEECHQGTKTLSTSVHKFDHVFWNYAATRI